MSRSVRVLAIEAWILRLLDAGPLSARELADRMFEETWESWAEHKGVGGLIEWGTDAEPLGARLLAFCEAKDAGLPPLHSWQLYSHLHRLERAGSVARIALPGRRPVLWRRSETSGSGSRPE